MLLLPPPLLLPLLLLLLLYFDFITIITGTLASRAVLSCCMQTCAHLYLRNRQFTRYNSSTESPFALVFTVNIRTSFGFMCFVFSPSFSLPAIADAIFRLENFFNHSLFHFACSFGRSASQWLCTILFHLFTFHSNGVYLSFDFLRKHRQQQKSHKPLHTVFGKQTHTRMYAAGLRPCVCACLSCESTLFYAWFVLPLNFVLDEKRRFLDRESIFIASSSITLTHTHIAIALTIRSSSLLPSLAPSSIFRLFINVVLFTSLHKFYSVHVFTLLNGKYAHTHTYSNVKRRKSIKTNILSNEMSRCNAIENSHVVIGKCC